jgi:hypothetical protein
LGIDIDNMIVMPKSKFDIAMLNEEHHSKQNITLPARYMLVGESGYNVKFNSNLYGSKFVSIINTNQPNR